VAKSTNHGLHLPSGESCLINRLQSFFLDQQLLNQVPSKVKKFVQEKDKEMFVIQRAFLNASGPLRGLHDCIQTGSNPTCEE